MVRIADFVAAGSMRELRNQVTGEFSSINRYVLVLLIDRSCSCPYELADTLSLSDEFKDLF